MYIEILYQVLLVFSFQSPLSLYHTSHQMSTVIFILSQNRDFRLHFCYYQLSYQVVYLYQNLTIKIITHTPLLHVTYTPDSPPYFVCVYMQPAPTLFLCVCVIILIVSSLPLFVCVQNAGLFISRLHRSDFCIRRMQQYTLGLWVSVMKLVLSIAYQDIGFIV